MAIKAISAKPNKTRSHVKVTHTTVYLISIYDKSEMENISDNTIKERLKGLE